MATSPWGNATLNAANQPRPECEIKVTQSSPYRGLPASAFWRTGFAETSYPPPGLYEPRHHLTKSDRIVTAGSCFAQHVGRTLRNNGFNVLDKEPVSEDPRDIGDQAQAYGYGLYTARYGNIYTARQLKQILLEALGRYTPADPVWERDGHYFDTLRPNIEPEGFASVNDLRAAREHHLQRVKEAFTEADVFVFTLGLTEAWLHRPTGQVYAIAPGTIAGSYDPALHVFKNFRHHEIMSDLRETLDLLKTINPGLRVLLTVSPVPLTATATGDHVLPATILSKSVLRACAGEMREDYPEVDYFPSYEILTSSRGGAKFFEDNLRSVTADGVALAMRTFVTAHMPGAHAVPEETATRAKKKQPGASKKKSKQAAAANEAEPGRVPAERANVVATIAGLAIPASPISSRKKFLDRISGLEDAKPDDVACAEAVVREGDRVLEIGARLGVVSAFLAKTNLPAAIRSYEDNGDLIPHIQELYAINGISQQVDLRPDTVRARPGGKPSEHYRSEAPGHREVQFSDIVSEFKPDVLLMNMRGDEVDFLMQADLKSLRGLAVRWHPKITGIEGLRKCKRRLKKDGFEVIEPVSTRLTWAVTR
ncbi:GSCFA domain-containing protein [Paracoccus aerodenitrificans]|uniref:GSCFA domain-containing protein n=1 Tax=Paracoccus aerodenitrificans TaxID=3017781 RepID=UPI0022F132C0|nr:GSCFA domain-containing protein [Paracoccus aerodenitrificans]WBU63539.1 GSCFA domain-containing protein [Paracoccus aerodenitrificans]